MKWGEGESVRAWQDRMLAEQGIEVAMPAQTDRSDAWLVSVQRMTDLREKSESGEITDAERIELHTLWNRYTPQPKPKLPTSYTACLDRIVAVKARLDDPATSDTVFNRLSWNFADLINLLATNVEKGVWIGDARMKGLLSGPVDSAHRYQNTEETP